MILPPNKDKMSINRLLVALMIAARAANATNGYFLQGYGT